MTSRSAEPTEISTLDGDLRIGEFLFRPLLKKVVRLDGDGEHCEEHSLPDKAVGVLVYLADHARQVCERDEILDAVWGKDRAAYDRVLDNAVAEIRRALGDDARKPSYVQTVHRRGYRWLVPVDPYRPGFRTDFHLAAVTQVQTLPSPGSRPPETIRPPRSSRAWKLATLLAILVLVVWLGSHTFWSRFENSPGDRWKAEIDVAGLAPLGSVPELKEEAHDYLFAQHPCAERSLLQPVGELESSDLLIRLGLPEDAESRPGDFAGSPIEASWTWPGAGRQAVAAHVQADRVVGSEEWSRFLTQISTELDASLCRLEGRPKELRACHCWASIRGSHLQNEPARMIEDLRLAIDLDPDMIVAYEALALIYQSLGSSKVAQSVLISGLERISDPASSSALILRRRLAAVLNDLETELQMIEKLRELYPDDPRWTLAKAVFLARNGKDCRQALELYQSIAGRSLNESATTLESSWPLWKCSLQGGFEFRLGVAPHESGRRLQLGIGAMLSGRLDEAKEMASELLALQPEVADSYWLMGSIAWRSGEYGAANRWFDRMKTYIEWPAERNRYYAAKCRLALLENRSEDCLDLLSSPHEPEFEIEEWRIRLNWLHGLNLLALGRLDEARQIFEKTRSDHELQGTTYLEWHLLHFEGLLVIAEASEKAEVGRGVDLLLAAVEMSPPDFAIFATDAALALERLGEPDRAEDLYRRALDYNPTYPWAHCRLGLMYRRQGRMEQAGQHIQKAIDVFGNPPEDPLGKQCAAALAESDAEQHPELDSQAQANSDG